MIYQATSLCIALLERTGLSQAAIATQSRVNRYHLAHVVAGRRHISGTYAMRIAAIYATCMDLPLGQALADLFTEVRERKSEGVRRRDATGRFVHASYSLRSENPRMYANEKSCTTDVTGTNAREMIQDQRSETHS